jgi:hypothetical protein
MENEDIVLDLRKALDTSAGTTGAVLIPTIVQEGIRMFVETRSPLYSIIEKVPGEGYAYGWREQNGLPVASFGAELAALPAAQNATYIARTVPFKSIYIRGELSGQVQAATRVVLNVLQREIQNSALGMARTLEDKIVSGDSASVATEFDGLNKWITTTVDADSDPGAGTTPGPLSLSWLDMLVDAPAGGPPTHFIMSKAMSRKLWSVVQPQVRWVDTNEIRAGLTVPSYGDIPIIRLFDNSTILNTTILAPDMNMVYMPVLEDITYEELAHTRDSIDYILKMYLTLVVEGVARHHAKLINVSSAIA